MPKKTAIAAVLTALAIPSAALAADDTERGALRPSGKLAHNADLDDRLVRTNVRLARRLDRKPDLRRLRTLPVSVLRERNARLRKRVARLTPATPPHLQAIAACESGGNPRAIGNGGQYRGKYQFSMSTWASVGGSGDPASAPEAEQDRRASILYARTGPTSWPVCGR
jgi:soluble lytic murein transglycosylase-like protein